MNTHRSFTGWEPEDSYFCIGDECLTPRLLKDLRYGCPLCEPAKLMNADAAQKLGVPITRGVFESHVLCKEHQLPIRPRCAQPACPEMIRTGAAGRPIRLVGGMHSGKTVYSAVVAAQLGSATFFENTGIAVTRIKGDVYLRETVGSLYSMGVLPKKTQGSHKIVYRFDQKGGPAEMIALHDMPGEQTPTFTIGYHSNKTLFLINPQAASMPTGTHPLAGRVPGHAFSGVEVLVTRLEGMAWLDTAAEHAVQSLCNQAANTLRDRGWPHCPHWPDLADYLLTMSQTALQRPVRAEVEDRRVLADKLENTAKGLCNDRTDFISQLDDWVETMRDVCGKNKFAEHRLALVFSKADLLGVGPEELEALCPSLHGASAGSPRALRASLNQLSDRARVQLHGLHLQDLVEKVSRQVGRVGFFFVSSLGRDTAIQVTRHDPASQENRSAQTAAASTGGGHVTYGGGVAAAPAAAAAPAVGAPKWELTEVLSVNRRDGTRAPNPRGVLNPLLWLLLG